MTAQVPAAPAPTDNSPLGTVMAMAANGQLSIPDLFGAAAVLQESGQLPAAIALYRTWIEHTPSPLMYAACFNLAVVLSNSGDDPGAEVVLRKAIAQNPNFIEARLNLGTLLERTGRPDDALAMWKSIINDPIEPDVKANQTLYVQTLNNLGRLLEIQKRYPEAEAMLATSLGVDPQQANVMTHWVHLRQKQCEWPVYAGLENISLATMMEGTSALAMLSASADPAQQLAAAKRFVNEKINAAVAPLTGQHGYGHQRLRIGYLSSDFCSHAVSILTAELYELHDRSKFEVYAFSWSREDGSPIRARVVKAMDHYIRIDKMTDEQAARTIRAHEIDILVDLHGLTLGARPQIIAYRPAPVQLTYLGFPGSTALPGIDYVISDEFLITPEMEPFFTEKPLHLQDCFQINDRQRAIAPTPTRASVNLPDDAFVFCSFNNNFKFTPDLFSVWMNILRRVPNSVLWLVADYPEVRENLFRHAEQAGIDRNRIIFNSRAVPAEYLARYQLADLFLDTFPFNAGTTASDALWAGLPLLTCAGQTFSSRMAGSLLRAVDLPQLITHSFEDYEEKAVELANNPARIASMKRQLMANRLTCALFDSPRFVRNMEAALQKVAKPAAPRLAAPEHAVRPQEPSQPAEPARIDQIPIITVSYNAPDLIEALLRTLRQFYSNRVYVIDGSNPDVAEQIRAITDSHDNVEFIPFGYNIHHGPGLAWAINHLGLSGEVLFLDSDVEILKAGFLESLHEHLRPGMYGVGNTQLVNEQGYDRPQDGAVRYLHPACMLTNIEVVRQWPLPIKHGAPLIPTMLAIHAAGAHDLIGLVPWVHDDFAKEPKRHFIKHDWQGTVIRTGGYHYDLPSSTTTVNADLLHFMPLDARKIVEVGVRDGTFAKAYKQRNAICNYTGIEADPAPAQAARPHCDFVFNDDIEHAGPEFWDHVRNADTWVLDESLEHMNDPWNVLQKIRTNIAPGGKIVATIRNFQHWSIQARLNAGDIRYGSQGLEKQRKRIFTRGAMLEMFQQAGFQISGGSARIIDEPAREKYLPAIRLMAGASGLDPVVAVEDALPWQYIVTAVAA
ncbi:MULTISPECIES: methyltransferase domain-containing protein [unclassified Duganella]|uniref:O-linked N-acetylglucosamine transferase family protein n=1 Tax=unclassified Duganella TaxID=2636909 RepID=UPI00088B8CDC|nr:MULTISPECIES: methyltransferase domain-containing protein [unclassified Duganella]SDH50056.1 Predicted O-linked N-acetylglucosamine transferase, SPINDLY family [Duganella sp. OV458]SDK63346.1 Predicted O-linked N-acetylglucosamine transferase, SPINDLY family [Duganella sp. OV510]